MSEQERSDSMSGRGGEKEALDYLAQGEAAEQAGKLSEALAHYDESVSVMPQFGRGHFCRGLVLLELARYEDAIIAFDEALECKPDSAAAYYNRGNALVKLGRYDEAADSYQKAVALKAEFPDAYVALGVALEQLTRMDEATESYKRALAFKPDYAAVYVNLGDVYLQRGEAELALECYSHVTEVDADMLAVPKRRAKALKAQGKLEEAVRNLRVAQASRTAISNDVFTELGAALKDLGKLEEAEETYRSGLKLFPDDTGLLNDLGVLLGELERREEACQVYQQALAIEPDNCGVLCNLGVEQFEAMQLDAAVASFEHALRIDADNLPALMNLASVNSNLGRLDVSRNLYRQVIERKPDYVNGYSNLLFVSNYVGDVAREDLFRDAEAYGATATRLAKWQGGWQRSADAERCLRVGLVSGDLRTHPVGFFIQGVLEALRRNSMGRLEFFAYVTHFVTDAIGEKIKGFCDEWCLVSGLSDEALANRIRDDGIDILIDLSGHTQFNRLSVFAWKPAPVQVSWLGYFATTGVKEMDYLLADPWTLPKEEEKYFTEKIWRLPETRLCFTPPDDDVPVSLLPALSRGYVTFGCFSNLTKMNDEVVGTWSRILKEVPGSKLLLKAKQIRDVRIRQEVVERFSQHGIQPGRLIFEGDVPRRMYLESYANVDIVLDTFPYPGGTTTVEALWMGVPVLTLEGSRFLSRQGNGLLSNAGLRQWVAKDREDYIAKAVRYALDVPSLALLRSLLRNQVLSSPIFNAERFARHFEDALRGMWRQWCATKGSR